MPKSRIMSAGTVGTSKRIRVNGPEGGGDKLQGLPPICNMRSPLVPYVRTRADGDNRNVVFCINQLSGGVGAKRGQFGPGNRAGVGQTGGCATGLNALTAVKILQEYFRSLGLVLILVGKKETLTFDGIGADHYEKFQSIKHYYSGTSEYATLPSDIRAAADLINNIGWSGPLKEGGPSVPHVVGTATRPEIAALFMTRKYGTPLKFGPKTTVVAYSMSPDLMEALFGCLGVIQTELSLACIGILLGLAPETAELDIPGCLMAAAGFVKEVACCAFGVLAAVADWTFTCPC